MNHVNFDYFGKPRKMKMTLNAVTEIELELNKTLYEIMSTAKIGINSICCILAACLRYDDKSFTTEKVKRWIEKIMNENPKENLLTLLPKYEEKITEAFEKSGLFGDPKKNDDLNSSDEEIKNELTEMDQILEPEKAISESPIL